MKRILIYRSQLIRILVALGGAGSGNKGHAGRPGKVGGSLPEGGEKLSFRSHPVLDKEGKQVVHTAKKGKQAGIPIKKVDTELMIGDKPMPKEWQEVKGQIIGYIRHGEARYYPEKNRVEVLGKAKETKRVYIKADKERGADEKWARVREMFRVKADEKLDKAHQMNRGDHVADAVELTRQMGLRPGSEKSAKGLRGAEATFGASTLVGENVKKEKGIVKLVFTGKNAKDLEFEVPPQVQNMLIDRARRAGPSGRLFPGRNMENAMRAYVRRAVGEEVGAKVKDLRTYMGTSEAMKKVKEMGKVVGSEKEIKRAMRKVAEHVAAKLGNTPSVALSSYIDPMVFAEWRKDA